MHNIEYKTEGLNWLIQALCPEWTFVPADRNSGRNP